MQLEEQSLWRSVLCGTKGLVTGRGGILSHSLGPCPIRSFAGAVLRRDEEPPQLALGESGPVCSLGMTLLRMYLPVVPNWKLKRTLW